jgi:hypothetical protein
VPPLFQYAVFLGFSFEFFVMFLAEKSPSAFAHFQAGAFHFVSWKRTNRVVAAPANAAFYAFIDTPQKIGTTEIYQFTFSTASHIFP